jgi:transposase
LFANSSFFKSTDKAQIKYEMLRRVAVEGESVRIATMAFGFSRQTFYQAQADFKLKGIEGLLPSKRSPTEGHKLTNEVLDFIQESIEKDPSLRIRELTTKVNERFGTEIHEQSIQRARRRIVRELDSASPRSTTFISDHLTIDFITRRVRAGDTNTHLTPTEFDILYHLFLHGGKPIPHRKLIRLVWGQHTAVGTQHLRVYINQLRKKIEPEPTRPRYVLTEPWIGYRFAIE